ILNYLALHRVGLSELLSYVLMQNYQDVSGNPVFDDLVNNTKVIIASLFYHPATEESTRDWSHRRVLLDHQKSVRSLSRREGGWHFSAANASPNQLAEFQLEDYARDLEERAPRLWELIRELLA
ncbi:uncharacterized protein BXZ73DRAFT_23016, partial [Epithele typhae]|uniref:uncharacterized protein n=1 Tax=Epithele typhae TaxID=378194 RepID=UPI0020078F7A